MYPSPSVTTEVTIIVTDVNDETPTFLSRQYIAEINENAEVNVPVNLLGLSIAEVFDHDQVYYEILTKRLRVCGFFYPFIYLLVFTKIKDLFFIYFCDIYSINNSLRKWTDILM